MASETAAVSDATSQSNRAAARIEGEAATYLQQKTRTVLMVCSAAPYELRNVFGKLNWTLHEAHNCREALQFLCRDRAAVIVCEACLADGDWRDILGYIVPLPLPPCLIVTSRLADDALWAEVLNLGGYDVLAEPFDAQEVSCVIAAALRQWGETSRRSLAMAAGAWPAAS